MGRNRKYFPHKAVLFCTTRTECGLPFVAGLHMNFILWGILARARSLYDVQVCHFVFLSNHLHLLLVVDNPAHVSEFMAYLKGESSHAVNRLLGRRQRTIWQDGYDSPIVLTADDAQSVIEYIYLNPSKAHLVERIEEYPGVSSWELYASGRHRRTCRRLNRSSIEPLWHPALSIKEQSRLVEQYGELPGENWDFVLEPDAWMAAYPELLGRSAAAVNASIVERVRLGEKGYAKQRELRNKRVLGSTALRRESITKEYVPKKFERRTVCRCRDRGLRKAFLESYRALCEQAREVFEGWRRGERLLKMPPGLLAPRMPELASALAVLV